MTHEITSVGLKIYNDAGKHIKTMAAKYLPRYPEIWLDLSKKRLTDNERSQLEVLAFHAYLKNHEPYLWELVEHSKPVAAQPVVVHQEERFELVYENGRRLKISKELYDAFPEKLDVRYSNY